MAENPRVQLQVRLPKEMHDALVARAKAGDRSLNETIIRALSFALTAANPTMKITTTREVIM